jgi:hypothetical protein
MLRALNNFKKRRTNNNEAQIIDVKQQQQEYDENKRLQSFTFQKSPPSSPMPQRKSFSLRQIITPKKKRKNVDNIRAPTYDSNIFSLNLPVEKSQDSTTPKFNFESPRKPLSPINYNRPSIQVTSPQSPVAKVAHQNYAKQFGSPITPVKKTPLFTDDCVRFSTPCTPNTQMKKQEVAATSSPKNHRHSIRRRVTSLRVKQETPPDKKFALGKRSRDEDDEMDEDDDDGFDAISPGDYSGEMFEVSVAPVKPTYSYCLRVFLMAAKQLINTEIGFKEFSNPYATLQVGDWRQSSTVCNSTLCPQYNQSFTFLISSHRVPRKPEESFAQVDSADENFEDPELLLRMFDHDNIFDHSFLGRKTIKLASMLREAQLNNRSTVYNQWMKLEGVASGEVHLALLVESGVSFGF